MESNYQDLTAKLRAIFDAQKPRSAWKRGVREYAYHLLDSYYSIAEYTVREHGEAPELTENVLLNGAYDWMEYSYGGCAHVYDYDIAHALCSPSELARKREGYLPFSSSESWIETQGRALRQAWHMIEAAKQQIENDVK